MFLSNLSATIGKLLVQVSIGGKQYELPDKFAWVNTLNQTVNMFLLPLFIAVAAAGTIYAVILGVNLARSENAEKRTENKQRLIWAIVGLVSIVVLILLLNLFMANLDTIIGLQEYAL